MKEGEFLFAIAQISAVYVGFSTLIVVIVQRFTGSRAALEAIRLDSMLRLSFLAVIFSLFPYLPYYLEFSVETTWRISCLLLGLSWLIYYIDRIRWIRSPLHKDALRYMSVVNRVHIFIVHPLGILGVLLGAFGLWGNLVGFAYLTGIFCLLLMAASVFVGLVKSLSSEKAE